MPTKSSQSLIITSKNSHQFPQNSKINSTPIYFLFNKKNNNTKIHKDNNNNIKTSHFKNQPQNNQSNHIIQINLPIQSTLTILLQTPHNQLTPQIRSTKHLVNHYIINLSFPTNNQYPPTNQIIIRSPSQTYPQTTTYQHFHYPIHLFPNYLTKLTNTPFKTLVKSTHLKLLHQHLSTYPLTINQTYSTILTTIFQCLL